MLADGARRIPGPEHRVFVPEITGQEVDIGADLLRHLVRKGPVRAEPEIGAAAVDAVHIVPEVTAEQVAAIVSEFIRACVCVQFCFFPERRDGAGVIVGDGRPAFPVHPGSVQTVVKGQFTQLGDQEGIDVGTVGADRPFVHVPRKVFCGMVGM